MNERIQTREDAVVVLESREGAYTFLGSAFFEEPTVGFLHGLGDLSETLDGELGAFAASLAEADLEAMRADLAAEYARLFLNMGPRPIPPYESVYTSDLHLLMQEARDEVIAIYRSEGIAVVTEVHIPEDHISLEFDFMGKMCRKTIAALEAGNGEEADRCLDVQAAFVNGHLARWVPDLCRDVRSHSKQPFYRAVADYAERFVAEESVLLAG